MEMIFQPHADKTLCKKDCALGVILKVMVFGSGKFLTSLKLEPSLDQPQGHGSRTAEEFSFVLAILRLES